MTQTTTQAPVVKIPTSPKLTELQATRKAQFAAMQKLDPDSADAEAALAEVIKTDGLIKVEKAAIVKAENDAVNAEKRNARLALVGNMISAYDAKLAVDADKKATPEAKQEAADKYDEARKVVENELLARYATSKPASTSGGDGVTKNGNTALILEAHLSNVAAGMTDAASRKALEDAGYKRSTVWHTVNNHNKAKV